MTRKKLSKEEVLHIADLCDLTLSEEEIDKLSEMLTDAIVYIKILDELDTEDLQETYQVTGNNNVFQKKGDHDNTLDQNEALSNAKEIERGMFATKAVFEER